MIKYSKTALMYLSHEYSHILKKCALLNAALLMSTAIALPANAENRVVVASGDSQTISDNLTNLNNPTLTGGAANNSGSLTVDEGVSFEGNTAHAGGAIYSVGENAQLTIGDNVSFTKNSTAENQDAGGALYAMGNSTPTKVTIGDNVNFSHNTSHQKAGAIFLEDVDLTIGDNATFDGNTSTQNAGAIYNWNYLAQNAKTTIGDNATFTNNTAGTNGGAIANYDGDITLGKNSVFDNNHADNGFGGAILNSNYLSNSAKLTLGDNATFTNNSASQAGAISNSGTLTIGKNSVFENNTAVNAGAIDSEGQNTSLTIGSGSKFLSNSSSNYAGALLFRHGTLTVEDDVEFSDNQSGTSGEQHSGGAVVIDSNDDNATGTAVFGNNAKFTGNKSTKSAGALYVYESKGKLQLTMGDNALFASNEAGANGGAIAVYGATNGVSIGKNAKFDSNTATDNGGALYLTNWEGEAHKASATFADGATFTNNSAKNGNGGAIYNAGTLTFTGSSVFSGNTDSTGANDIYNTGSITFNGDVTLEGGISGEIGSGSVTFADGVSLTAKLNTTTILADSVTFAGNNAIDLIIENGLANADYDFINANTLTGNKDVKFSNTVYDLSLTDEGKIRVGVKSADQIVDSLDVPVSEEEAATISALLETNNHGTDLGNQVTDAISTALQNGHEAEAVQAAQELAPTTSQQVMGVTQSVNELLTNVTGTRMSALGKAGGDAFVGGSVWVQGLYNHSKQDSSSRSAGFDADTEGIAFGIDGKANDAITIGAGYGYTKTNADSDGRKVDIDGHNFFVYGQYKPEKFYINTLLNYGFSKYTEKKSPMGILMKSKYDVNSFAANLMTGYDFDNGITPEAGLRYVLADQESYNDGAQNISTDKNDVLTAIMGVKYSTSVKANEWKLAPSVRLAATYDLMSDNSKANVNIIGGGNYQITGERLHRFGVEAGAGITATLRNVDLTLDYNGGFRKDFQSHTGMLKATYHF